MIPRHAFAAALLLLAACVTPDAAQDAADPTTADVTIADPTTVVARVNGVEITDTDIQGAYERLPQQYQQVPLEMLHSALVDQLVNGKLMLAEGLAQNLGTDEEVRRQVANFEALTIQQVYIERYIEARLTEEALRQRYDATVANAEGEIEVRARHILVEAEEETVSLIEQLNNGADFAELAREHSTGPSGPNGGDLGYFRRGDMVQPFADAAFALGIGEVAPFGVQTQFGWHVIKVEDRRSAAPEEFEAARDELRGELSNNFLEAHMAELAAAAAIERFNLDGTPLVEPGAN